MDRSYKSIPAFFTPTLNPQGCCNIRYCIEQHGGKNSGSVSGKTDYILAGENMGPAKLEKAAKLGVKVIGEEEFLNMIAE